MPTAAASLDGTRIGSRTGLERDEEDPVRELLGRVRGDLERQPRLAGPAGPVRVTSRLAASRAPASASSRSRPTNDVSCVGRLFGRASSERSGGNSAASPSADELAERLRLAEVLEPVLAEVAQRDAGGQVRREQAGVVVRDDDLAAVRGRRDPGGTVDVEPDVARRRCGSPRRCAGPSGRGPRASAGQARGEGALRSTAGRDGRRPRSRRPRRTSRPRCPPRAAVGARRRPEDARCRSSSRR